MPREVAVPFRFVIALVVSLLAAACGGGSSTEGTAADGSPPAAAAPSPAAEPVASGPDACTFLDRARIEEIVGRELREGKAKDAPPGFSECDFETPPLMYVTRTFPSPTLTESSGFSSLTINTHPASPQNFAEFRRTLGTAAEDVAGVGDGAYFYGPNLLYVRVGNRGFSLRIYADPASDADRARVREVMFSLAALGVSKL